MSPLRETLKKNTHLPVLQKDFYRYSPRNTPDNPPDPGDNFEKRVQNLEETREETVTTPSPKESEHIVTTPPSGNTDAEGVVTVNLSVPKEPILHKGESPSEYPFEGHPEAPLSAEDGSVVPFTDKTQQVPPDDPFSRFCSGYTADTSDKNKGRLRWLTRKPERRHSVDLEELDK